MDNKLLVYCFSVSSVRLVELAPQYFLGNLPASDGKELLMELRRSVAPPAGQPDSGDRTQKDKTAETHNQSSTELCVVQ